MRTKLSFKRTVSCLVAVILLICALPTLATEQSQDLAITNVEYKTDNKISVTITLSVDMQRKNGTVLVALYDKDNRLISCKTGTTVSWLYTFDGLNKYCGSYTAKAFYFESLTSIKPLCNTASMTLEGGHIGNSTGCHSLGFCSVCGESFITEHYLTYGWEKTDSEHFKTCQCHAMQLWEDHTYCTPVTNGENTLYQCVCGAQSETQTHKYPQTWTASDNGHYRICSLCGVKEEEDGHIDVVNHVCQKCGHELIHTGTIGGDDHSSVVIDPGGGGGNVVAPDIFHECGKHINIPGLNDGKDHSKCEHCNGYRCDDRDHSKYEHCNGYRCDGGNHNKCELCNGYRCDGRDDHFNGLCVFYIH